MMEIYHNNILLFYKRIGPVHQNARPRCKAASVNVDKYRPVCPFQSRSHHAGYQTVFLPHTGQVRFCFTGSVISISYAELFRFSCRKIIRQLPSCRTKLHSRRPVCRTVQDPVPGLRPACRQKTSFPIYRPSIRDSAKQCHPIPADSSHLPTGGFHNRIRFSNRSEYWFSILHSFPSFHRLPVLMKPCRLFFHYRNLPSEKLCTLL